MLPVTLSLNGSAYNQLIRHLHPASDAAPRLALSWLQTLHVTHKHTSWQLYNEFGEGCQAECNIRSFRFSQLSLGAVQCQKRPTNPTYKSCWKGCTKLLQRSSQMAGPECHQVWIRSESESHVIVWLDHAQYHNVLAIVESWSGLVVWKVIDQNLPRMTYDTITSQPISKTIWHKQEVLHPWFWHVERG